MTIAPTLRRMQITLFFLCLYCFLYAQYDNHVWFFGSDQTGIKFDTDTTQPANYNVHVPLMEEGGAVVLNPETGDFLFYTDGNTVYNETHQIVENGDNLGSCWSSVQAAVVLPIPCSVENEYYVFSNSKGSGCNDTNICVSIVNMNANGGAGSIPAATKKMLLHENVHEGMITIPKPSPNEYWLIGTSARQEQSHFVYSITPTGIALHGIYYFFDITYHFSLSVHPDFTKIAGSVPGNDLFYSLDFNPETGTLSNMNIINDAIPYIYDSEWSPDGSKVYYSKNHTVQLYQYDLDNNVNTLLYDGENQRGGGLKMGPDDKIYFIHDELSTLLSTITNSDAPGLAAGFFPDSYNANGSIQSLNFPQTIAASKQYDNNIITGVVNQYSAVTAICNNSFSLQDIQHFNVGDEVLIIQMKGATIDTSNTSDFGEILSYGNAGNYEFNQIQKIENNSILFKNKLLNEYDAAGKVQLVKIPNLGNASVCNLSCKPWDGTTGGVLVFRGGTIEMEGNIDVSGKGFKGGIYTNEVSPGCNSPDYFYASDQPYLAGAKGEGIYDFSSIYNRGKGHIANGAGGGNNHNTGGGGGGNGGSGGNGGIYWACSEGAAVHHGIAGQALLYDEDNARLFCGGGGGAGHSNNEGGTGGGHGGGIIIAIVDNFISNHNAIMANGANARVHPDYPLNRDGGGGGGAGGSILLYLSSQSDSLNISIKGGQGSGVKFNHGHGGGGGGGVLFLNTYLPDSINLYASGGLSGRGIDNNTNGATAGQAGNVFILEALPQSTAPYFEPAITGFTLDSNCDETSNIIGQFHGGTPPHSFSLDNINWTPDPVFYDVGSGDYTLYIKDDCLSNDTLITVDNAPLLDVLSEKVIDFRCDSLGALRLQIAGGLPPYQYRLDDNAWTMDNTFLYLPSGNYTWEVKDSEGCQITNMFDIKNLTEDLSVALPPEATIKKGSDFELTTQIAASVGTGFFYEWLEPLNLSCYNCPDPVVSPEENTPYRLVVTDDFGCSGAAEVFIRVDQNEIYIPNVFSPNGDGVNDYFHFGGDFGKVKQVKRFCIYNRWGEQVFGQYNFKLDNSFQGWDGHFQGMHLKSQVLAYHIVVEMYDGFIINEIGDITLIGE